MALIFIVWYGLKEDYFDVAYFLYQGVLVNPYLLFRYALVYRAFRAYHLAILAKYQGIFSEEESATIKKTTSEVRTVFIYICQMLALQSLYLTAICIELAAHNAIWSERFFDTVNISLMVSYILMYIGFSNSIKRAFKAQLKSKIKSKKLLSKA